MARIGDFSVGLMRRIMSKVVFMNVICILALLVIGCNRSVDTSILDEFARSKPALEPFVDSVKQFYKALQDNEWEKTYEFRTNDFKQITRRAVYMEIAENRGKSWSLNGYEILDVLPYSVQGQEPSLIRLIIKFQEDNFTSYNVVWWIKEENSWHCLNAGPIGPAGLSGLFLDGRIPNYLFKEFKKYD